MSALTIETTLPAIRVQRTAPPIRLGPWLAVGFLGFLIVAALLPWVLIGNLPPRA